MSICRVCVCLIGSYPFLGRSSSHICGRTRSWRGRSGKKPPGRRRHGGCRCQCRELWGGIWKAARSGKKPRPHTTSVFVLLEQLQDADDDVVYVTKPRRLQTQSQVTLLTWWIVRHRMAVGGLTSNFLAWCKPPAQLMAMSQIWRDSKRVVTIRIYTLACQQPVAKSQSCR